MDSSGKPTFVLPGIGARFVPYLLTIPTGEDVLGRILSLCNDKNNNNGRQGVCVVVASGNVSSTKVRERGLPIGDPVAYQGNFEIVRLKGLFLPVEESGGMTTSGLSIILQNGPNKGPNKNMIKGVVSDELIAASEVNVVVGSFKVEPEMVVTAMEQPGVLDQVPILPRYKYFKSSYSAAMVGAIEPLELLTPPPPPPVMPRLTDDYNRFSSDEEEEPMNVAEVMFDSAGRWVNQLNDGDPLETIFFYPF